MTKVIVIDPFECTVTEADVTDDYKSYYPLLSHEHKQVTCFDACYPRGLAGRDAVFVDDEGLFGGPQHFFRLAGYPNPLAGKGLIVGADVEGNSISAETPIEEVRKQVRFLLRVFGAAFVEQPHKVTRSHHSGEQVDQ